MEIKLQCLFEAMQSVVIKMLTSEEDWSLVDEFSLWSNIFGDTNLSKDCLEGNISNHFLFCVTTVV